MKNTILQLALRETQSIMGAHKVQAALIAIGLVLGLAGPFDTEDAMRIAPRVLYWLVVIQVTFASGKFISAYFAHSTLSKSLPKPVVAAVSGAAIGLVITLEILGFNWAIFDVSPFVLSYSLPLVTNVVLVSVVVRTAIAVIVSKSTDQNGDDHDETSALPPALIDRLPFDKRGALISLSVNDHYVDVVTTKGQEMLLMRLADAMREAGTGLQVHRSHWIATDHIASVTRDGAKAVIKTSDGRDIPVSRTYVPKLKEAGFLP